MSAAPAIVPDNDRLLIDETPLQFLPSLAIALGGTNEALLLQQLHFLCKITEKARNHSHYHEGKWWVYNSYDEWHEEHFPWISTSTIKRLFLWLEEKNLVLSRPKVQGRSKVGKWYSVNYTALRAIKIEQKTSKKVQNGTRSSQNDTGTSIKMRHPRMSQNEPSNKAETTTENTYRETAAERDTSLNTPPFTPSKTAAASQEFLAIQERLSAISATLPDPFTGIGDLANTLLRNGKTAADVDSLWSAMQYKSNPAGAFIHAIKTNLTPKTKPAPKPQDDKPKDGDTKMVNGVKKIFKSGKWYDYHRVSGGDG